MGREGPALYRAWPCLHTHEQSVKLKFPPDTTSCPVNAMRSVLKSAIDEMGVFVERQLFYYG